MLKSFKQFISESSVEDFLIWEPEGKFRKAADVINKLKSKNGELYRGVSKYELDVLKQTGSVKSKGKGNTSNIDGSYLSDNVHLAGRFALVALRDTGTGYIMVLDKKKLPDLEKRDGMKNYQNYATSNVTKDSIKKIIKLGK